MNTESQNVEINILSNNQELEVEELSLNVEIENMSLEVEMQNSDVEIETQSNDIEIEDEVLRVFEKDHRQLKNLDFESSGHTGFQKAGDYALKEEVPKKLSELENDRKFATESYVDNEIATFDFIKVVDNLPETGLPNKIYFVPKNDTQTQDLFDEYVWVNGKWEWITTKQIEVDLTPYARKEDIPDVSNFVEDADYVHTDNNYTDEDKEKLDSLENITVDAKNIPFEDNYGYGTPDNIQDALDYAFNEIDNRPLYSDLACHVAYHYHQHKSEGEKQEARKNIGARGVKWLGEIDVDEYDGDTANFIDTLIEDGDYSFVDSYDNFYWYVSVYNIDNVLLGQTYYNTEEGYINQYYRMGYYNEDSNTVEWDDWRYNLNNVSGQNMFAPKSHVHYKNISTSLPIRTYLGQYTSFGDKDLRVVSGANKHLYIVKMDYYNYNATNGIYYYVRYQEYYDIEEPNKIYKRTGDYNPNTRIITWNDWYVFEGVNE